MQITKEEMVNYLDDFIESGLPYIMYKSMGYSPKKIEKGLKKLRDKIDKDKVDDYIDPPSIDDVKDILDISE